ncbi:hypothetical protein AJ88_47705 [Mesorhizobium amorphae CCBAU 01583]|nr:hypothetical protein AJ88_47705 [Mesorhizobium amorphae CCBAU 01583]
MIGIFRRYQRPDHPLGLAVSLGDRVEAARFLVGDGASATEARQRLGGGGIRDAPHEIDADVQLILPRCSMSSLPVISRRSKAWEPCGVTSTVARMSRKRHQNAISTS